MGLDAMGDSDTWEPLDKLTDCEIKTRNQSLLEFRICYRALTRRARWAARARLWEPLGRLTSCKAAIAALEQATGRPLPPASPSVALRSSRRCSRVLSACRVQGGRSDAVPPGDMSAALVGWTLLYRWPDDGWRFSHCPAAAVGRTASSTASVLPLRLQAPPLQTQCDD